MKKIYMIFALCLTAGLLTSCSDDEDTTPTFAEKNAFAPAADDNSPTAQLQRSFYEETGVYLLFSDKLQPSLDGQEPEYLDLSWSLGGTSSYEYSFDYITDIETQRLVAESVKKNLLDKLGKAKPFSIFISNDINYMSYGRLRHTTSVLGTRCYAFSLDEGYAMDDLDGHFSGMLVNVLTDILARYSTDLKPFYDISSEYYSADLEDFGWEELTEQETWNLGFFEYYDYWGAYFPSQKNDFAKWITMVTSMSREEFEETYGSSATMMNKYELLMGVLDKIGIKI